MPGLKEIRLLLTLYKRVTEDLGTQGPEKGLQALSSQLLCRLSCALFSQSEIPHHLAVAFPLLEASIML